MTEKFMKPIERVGDVLVELFHTLGLFVIGAFVVWSAAIEILEVFHRGGPKLEDILLLFIYLEIGAMVGIYFKTKHLPVRFLLYVLVTAITRLLVIDIKHMSDTHILVLTAAILVTSIAILILRFGSSRFPSQDQS
jgi:phosphate starvation-inducible membrane PsiE